MLARTNVLDNFQNRTQLHVYAHAAIMVNDRDGAPWLVGPRRSSARIVRKGLRTPFIPRLHELNERQMRAQSIRCLL